MSIAERDYMRGPAPKPPRRPRPIRRTFLIFCAAFLAAACFQITSGALRLFIADRHSAHEEPEEQGPVNLNTATLAEIDAIPYISPAVAQAIINHRPYTDYDELLEVPGIKERRLETILPYITLGEDENPGN